MSLDWTAVADTMRSWAATPKLGWKLGQDDGLRWMADRIASAEGLLLADEVGLGKTRLAIAAMHAVSLAGGRILVVAPATLLHQWDGERSKFLKALGTPEPIPATADGRHLRHFNDLFREGCRYPLCAKHPFVMASHTFGIPQKIGASAQPYTWALPFIVRSFAQYGKGNWSGARTLKSASAERRLGMQLRAAEWLSQRSAGLKGAMAALPPLNMDAGAAFAATGGERERQLRGLLQALVGRLMGPFDLVVIDEAHRSREEIGADAAPRKRLTNLLEQTIIRAPDARRLALTATPVQLSADDWKTTLQRIGVGGDDLARRARAIGRFDETCAAHRAGPSTAADVDALCKAADGFRDALSDVVVRRRWSDQRIMESARAAFGDDGAHPHRGWTQRILAWDGLTRADRMAFLAAEGRAPSSRGTALDAVERHRAARHAQAMDEIDADDEPGAEGPAEGVASTAVDTPRHAYWVALQNAMRARHAQDGSGGLARHPRIAEACAWVEDVTDAGLGKVLVFANYTRPLLALSRALNVRRFLRDVAAGKPTRAPASIGGDVADHPLVQAALATMPDRDRILAAGDLRTLVRRSEADYQAASARLAKTIERVTSSGSDVGQSERIEMRLAALEWMLDVNPGPDELEAKIADLVQGLAAAPSADDGDEADPRTGLLAETLTAEDGYSLLRRSDFARELYGNSTASRRHVLQALFNTPGLRPQVLVAQSRVAAEGLNLHEACRHVLFLHLDWNPATIEQQIGRVDRVGSLWSKEFEATGDGEKRPRIELATIVIEGTSDADRKGRILARQRALGAHLFGELLPPDVMRGLDPDWRLRLTEASPSFSPRLPSSERNGDVRPGRSRAIAEPRPSNAD